MGYYIKGCKYAVVPGHFQLHELWGLLYTSRTLVPFLDILKKTYDVKVGRDMGTCSF